jgi:autotransporter translocation and assembly factor TamB
MSDTETTVPRRRRIRRALALIAALALAAVAAASAFIQTATFRDWFRDQVVAAANAELEAELSIAAIEGNPFGTIVLRDVSLVHEGEPLASVRRAEVRLDLLGLVTLSRIALQRLAVDGLEFHLRQDDRGWNVTRLVPEAPPSEEEEAGIPFSIVRCIVERSSVRVTLPDRAYEMEDLSLEGGLAIDADGVEVRIGALSFDMPRREVRVNELAGRLYFAEEGRIDIEGLRLRTEGTELSATARLFGTGEDGYRADVQVPRISAAELQRLTDSTLPASDLSASIQAAGPPSKVAVKAEVSGEAGRVAVSGTLGLAGEPIAYDLQLDVEKLNANALLGPEPPPADLSGRVKLAGRGVTAEEADTTFDLVIEDSRVAEASIDRLVAKGRIERQRIEVEASVLTAAGSAEIGGSVHLTEEEYDVRLTARQLDPAALLGLDLPRASLNGSVAVAGRGFTPAAARGEASVELARSTVNAVAVESLRFKAQLARERLTVETLSLDSSVASVEASGDLPLAALDERGTPGSLRYNIRVGDLGAVARLGGVSGVRGQLEVAGTAAGSAKALDVDATLSGRVIERERIRAGELSGEITGRRLGAAGASGRIRLRAANGGAGDWRFESLDLAVRAQRREVGASATADLDLREKKRHHNLSVAADLLGEENRFRIAALRFEAAGQTWTAEGEPTFVQRGRRVAVDGFHLRSAAGAIRLQGEAGTEGVQALELTADGVDLGALAKDWQLDAAGVLSAQARLEGTADQPRLALRAVVDGPAVGEVRYQSIEIDASAAAERAALAVRVVQSPERTLALEAALPLRFSLSPVRFEAAGGVTGSLRAADIDLAFLDPAVAAVADLRGILNADLRIEGEIGQPDVRGTLAVTGGRARILPIGITYDPVELSARVETPDVIVEALRIEGNGGRLDGRGTIRLTASEISGGVRIDMRRFPLFQNVLGEGRTSGWLSVNGSTTAPVIEGELETDRLVFRIPETLAGSVRPPDPTIIVIGPGAPELTEEEQIAAENERRAVNPLPALWERTVLQVRLDVPRNAWIRRSDANVELRGRLNAWKKAQEPFRLAGEINAVRGWYKFQGKKFNVQEGKVIFTGQTLEPLLDLTATHRVRDYLVRIRLGGSVAKPTLALESEPSMEQADILAVLLFGKRADELGTGESIGLREQALGIVGGYAASELRESVADALGVDNLEFDTGEEGLADSRVAVGKYLTEDVFVTLAHRFGKESLQELRVEYFFLPQWSIETSADTLGNSGIDLFWRRRY